MKKIIVFLLSVTILLNVAACASLNNGSNTGSGNETTAPAANTAGNLLVGYGKVNISPTESVPLAGYGSTEKRMSNGKKSELYEIAVAITTPDGETGIIISADICNIDAETTAKIRQGIQAECGVPADNVIISSIHQHSTVDMTNSKVPSAARYRDEIFIPGGVEAAKLAMANRAPATVQYATVVTEGMNFIRHYLMNDGTYTGPNFGDRSSGYKDYAGTIDPTMLLIKFVREGETTVDGKKARNIILANFQGHPLLGASSTDPNFHSDAPGVFRDTVAEKQDAEVIYISGASGNVALSSQIKEDMKSTTDFKQYGMDLAKYANSKNVEYTDLELSAVKATKVKYTGATNHDEDHLLEKAEKVWAEFQKTEDDSIFRKNGFESRYHCSLLISHANLPPTKSMDLFAISFGDLAFIGAPYEMFCETGTNIKAASPFKTTVVCYIANGSNGYLPTEQAWDFYCYERHNSSFTRGTAELCEAEFIKMLNGLYEQY